jgi:hypothetical protein
LFISLIFSGCSKQYFYSGIVENSYQEIYSNYEKQKYSKEYIVDLIGPPLVKDLNNNLWIYSISKEYGNESFKKIIYKKSIKMYFTNNNLSNILEVSN